MRIDAATAVARAIFNAITAGVTHEAYFPNDRCAGGPFSSSAMTCLLDQGVVAVTLVGLDDARRVASDEGVVAVGRKQLALSAAVGCERLESFHASNGQTAGHVFGFAAAREATQGTLATSASLTQRCSFSS